jgi:hypothetical protein
MSLKTWLAEYYPIPADSKRVNPRNALEHSIRKWIGLLHTNMERHGVRWSPDCFLTDGVEEFCLMDTCSLCVHFYDADVWAESTDSPGSEDGPEVEPCSACPLYKSRGGKPCSWATYDELRRGIDKFDYDESVAYTPWGLRRSEPEWMLMSLVNARGTKVVPLKQSNTGK